MTPVPALLTTSEVAERLSVSPSTVTRWAETGKLSSVLLPSGRRRYRTEDVDAVLATATTETETDTAGVA